MKKLLLILSIILISFNCKAQDDIINYNNITINNIILAGQDKSILYQTLGQPVSNESYFFEIENKQGELIKYNGILFYTIDNRIVSFEITGSQYSFTSHNIRVGDNISKLKSIYPKSYENKRSNAIGINIVDYDMFIIVEFNSSNIINLIALGSY